MAVRDRPDGLTVEIQEWRTGDGASHSYYGPSRTFRPGPPIGGGKRYVPSTHMTVADDFFGQDCREAVKDELEQLNFPPDTVCTLMSVVVFDHLPAWLANDAVTATWADDEGHYYADYLFAPHVIEIPSDSIDDQMPCGTRVPPAEGSTSRAK